MLGPTTTLLDRALAVGLNRQREFAPGPMERDATPHDRVLGARGERLCLRYASQALVGTARNPRCGPGSGVCGHPVGRLERVFAESRTRSRRILDSAFSPPRRSGSLNPQCRLWVYGQHFGRTRRLRGVEVRCRSPRTAPGTHKRSRAGNEYSCCEFSGRV
jgi:hypothetical protein